MQYLLKINRFLFQFALNGKRLLCASAHSNRLNFLLSTLLSAQTLTVHRRMIHVRN